MANYKASDITGTAWQRAVRMVLENPIKGAGSVLVVEETAIDLGEQTITQLSGNLHTTFEQGKTFDLYNPLTGEKTGATMTHDEYYAISYSVYMTLAAERDAAAQSKT